MSGDPSDGLAAGLPNAGGQPEYVLHLYIAGATPNSTRAVQNLKTLCTQFLAGRYELLIIDIHQQPELAKQQQIIASPTLLKMRPLPMRRLVGDLSERNKVLAALGLPAAGTAGAHD